MIRLSYFPATLIFALLLGNQSCKIDYGGYLPSADKIKTGSKVDVSSSIIGVSGGVIKVAKPGTPVDGMEIVIPDSSYSSGQTFLISYAEIESHKFGEYFNPISPMITITCDGGYARELMSLKIPVNIPEGYIAVGFYFDESTGKLEGIPVDHCTPDSITLQTRHFQSGNMLRSEGLFLKSVSTESNKGANIIISSIKESVLNAQTIIASACGESFLKAGSFQRLPGYG